MGSNMRLPFTGRAGVSGFIGAVFKELTPLETSHRVSDHFPLWVEFVSDGGTAVMATQRGLNPDSPDPFASLPDESDISSRSGTAAFLWKRKVSPSDGATAHAGLKPPAAKAASSVPLEKATMWRLPTSQLQ
jgi:hypothetical protein